MTASRGARVRRSLLSRVFAVALIAVVLLGTAWSFQALTARSEQRIAEQALSTGRVIAAATVDSHVDWDEISARGMARADAVDLQNDAEQLREAGQLQGLAMWHADGRPLFLAGSVDGPSMTLSPAAVQQHLASSATAVPTTGAFRVFIPYASTEPGLAHTQILIELVVPLDTAAAAANVSAARGQIALAVLVLLLIVGLVWLRRGLLRRERHARTDQLTGLLNRRALLEDARRLLAEADPSEPAALLLIDLAEFKKVNDTLGHATGDLLLRQVAATLKRSIRGSDLVVRLGGDEFAVLLSGLPNGAAGQLRAEELLALVRNTPVAIDGLIMSVDASIGVALAPEHGRDVDTLLQRADVAMYAAKRGHRGTMLYDASTDKHTVAQLTLVDELRGALDRDEFVLHYQPKISLPDRTVYGVEALLRWQHPTHGLLMPGDFLPLLESTGLIQPVSQWVLRTAVHQAAAWRQAGMPLKVAVNMSTRSLMSPALPGHVLSTLVGAELPPSSLELEITETAIMANPEQAAFILTQLRGRGIDVSIDDFGAGYTSLAFLRILPVTALKVDRSLVTHMLENPADAAITETVINLGHRLGLRVIAEGVETEQVLRRLEELGCERAQGYHISRPVPSAELEAWLRARVAYAAASVD